MNLSIQLQNICSKIDSNRFVTEYKVRDLVDILSTQYKLEVIGEGSSRIVLKYDKDTVIKIAYNKIGLIQNEKEAELSSVYPYQALAKVYHYSTKFKYLIVEHCSSFRYNKLYDNRLLELITGFCSLQKVSYILEKSINSKIVQNLYNDLVNIKNTISLCNIADIYEDQLGFNSNKHLLIVDYGLDSDLLAKYY